MKNTSLSILNMLADGESMSGEVMGQQLGVSRMAISKAIKGLNEQGLGICSSPGKGYQLISPLQLLDAEFIRSRLSKSAALCKLDVLSEVGSTSDHLLREVKSTESNPTRNMICIAETQSRGRGRRDRQWHAGAYRNITLSIAWKFDDGMSALSGLGIASGICIVQALHKIGLDSTIGLKWPNDIVWHDKKLGGVLIDVRGEHSGPCTAVLGLGLNLSLSESDSEMIDQAFVSLEDISSASIDRNSLMSDLINNLCELFQSYPETGFDEYLSFWPQYDRLFGRNVTVQRGDSTFLGVAAGINEQGALLLEEGSGITGKFMSGDVSLRLAQ